MSTRSRVGQWLKLIAPGQVDKIAKLIPNQLHITLEQSLQSVPEMRELKENSPQIAELLNNAQALEGLTRHVSTHAAGVVISPKPLVEFVPLYKGTKEDDEISTQYSMSDLEKIGLLKMDFLGLRNLTMIKDTLRTALTRADARRVSA